MGVSDVVVRNLMTVYLVVITAVKAPGLVSGQEFSGVFVLVIATAMVGVILIASIIWDFVEKRANHWWHMMITRVLKLVEGVSVGMVLLYDHLTSDSGFLNINFVPTTRMKSSNPFVVLLWVFFLSSSSSTTSPRISVAALDVKPNTPYYILTITSYNDTISRGLLLADGLPCQAGHDDGNGIPFKFSPVKNTDTVENIRNDTEVRFSTEDGKDVGIVEYKGQWLLATADAVENVPNVTLSDATFHIKKGDDDKFSLVYNGNKTTKRHVNRDRFGHRYLGDLGEQWNLPHVVSADWYFELLAA